MTETDDRFKKYRKKNIAEMRPFIIGEETGWFKMSQEDIVNGHPKEGDMIGRDPANHNDQWLVSKEFFEDNYEEA